MSILGAQEVDRGAASPGTNQHGLRSLGKKIAHYAPGALGPALFGLLTAAIYTRVFDAPSYGRYSLALTITSLFAALSTQWLQQAVNRYIPAERETGVIDTLKRAVATSLIVIEMIVAPLLVVAGFLAARFVGPEWKGMFWPGFVLIVATSQYSGLVSVLQSEMKAARYSAYQLTAVGLRFALSAVLVFAVHRNAVSLVWGSALSSMVLVPFLWRDCGLPHPLAALKRWHEAKPLVNMFAVYGFPMVGWYLSAYLLDAGDRYVIQIFRGSSELGIYSANYGLVNGAASLIAGPVLLAAHPFLMNAWGEGNRTAAARWLGIVVTWFSIAGLLVVGFSYVFAKDIAQWLLGPAFREGYRIIPVVIAGNLLWQLGIYVHKPFEFTGQTARMLWYAVTAAVLNLVSNLLLVPTFGYMAAAYTTVGSYACYVFLASWRGRTILPWTIPWKTVRLAALCVSVGVIAAVVVRSVIANRLGYWPGILAAACMTLATTALVILRLVWPLVREGR